MLLFVVFRMIIHSRVNPDSSGRPPTDRITARIRAVMMGILFHACDSDNMVVAEL